jgi:hypothetical protein
MSVIDEVSSGPNPCFSLEAHHFAAIYSRLIVSDVPELIKS